LFVEFGNGLKPFQVKAFGSQGAIQAFDQSILAGLSRLDKTQFNTILIRPFL
jgi:hypothetical protein